MPPEGHRVFLNPRSPSRISPTLALGMWVVLLFALVTLPPPRIFAAVGVVTFLALLAHPAILLRLLRRSRWLLAVIVVMFGWFTPGMSVSYLPGATLDGLVLAAEQSARIVLSLAMVGLLLGYTDPVRLVGGLHGMLRPVAALGCAPGRLAVRLLLVLESFEDGATGSPRERASLALPRHRWGRTDSIVLLALLGAIWLRLS